jgi:hypothetical protein
LTNEHLSVIFTPYQNTFMIRRLPFVLGFNVLLCLCILPMAAKAQAQPLPVLEYDTVRQSAPYTFCLPVPRRIFKEDAPHEDYPGKRVFLSLKGNSLIVYQCFMMDDTPWPKVYERDAASISKRLHLAKFTYQKLGPDYYILSYKKEKKVVYLKKWLLKGQDNVLTIEFEYPEDQKPLFDRIIRTVTGFNPLLCK